MTQAVPATCVLGPGKTGLTIGLRVLNADRTVYAAFSTTGVSETGVAGTYSKAGLVTVPAAGGHIVWGTALVDLVETTVDAAAVVLEAYSAALRDIAKNLEDQLESADWESKIASAVIDALNANSVQQPKRRRSW